MTHFVLLLPLVVLTIHFMILFPHFQFSCFGWFNQVATYSFSSCYLEILLSIPWTVPSTFSPQIPHDLLLLKWKRKTLQDRLCPAGHSASTFLWPKYSVTLCPSYWPSFLAFSVSISLKFHWIIRISSEPTATALGVLTWHHGPCFRAGDLFPAVTSWCICTHCTVLSSPLRKSLLCHDSYSAARDLRQDTHLFEQKPQGMGHALQYPIVFHHTHTAPCQ